MFTDLEKLIDFELFLELFDTLAEKGEYKYSENGLNISAKSSDGTLSLQVSYEEPKNLAKEEATDFENFVKQIDDDLFIDVCESLGQDNLTKIVNCLGSEDIDTVRSGILRFKKELKDVINNKIEYYQECLANLLK